ncbi:MAG: hypothetical protein ACP5TY_03970 [Thermodesulforhabdaceae bacterium]
MVETLKLIAITGKAYENYDEKAIEEGADYFLLKPIRFEELSEAVCTVCNIQQSSSQKPTEPEEEAGRVPENLFEELKLTIMKADVQSFIRKVKESSGILGNRFSRSLIELAQNYRYQEVIELLNKKAWKRENHNGAYNKAPRSRERTCSTRSQR